MRYDIAIIGNDEAAVEMACAAAAAQMRTVAILPEARHSAWMMSLAFRRLVSGLLVDCSTTRREMLQQSGTPRLLQRLVASAAAAETSDQMRLLEGLGVDVILGEARFHSRSEILVSAGINVSRIEIHATHAVIGTGVRQTGMHRPLGLLPIHGPESLFEGLSLPHRLCLVGGGSLSAGLAALFSMFGVRTQLLTREDDSSALLELAEAAGVRIAHHPSELGLAADCTIPGGTGDIVDCRRSVGFTQHLNLSAIGVEPDENGQLWCASNLETWCPGVFGIGDVVGFSPDSTMSSARQAARILNRITHPIPRPNFLRVRARRSAEASGHSGHLDSAMS